MLLLQGSIIFLIDDQDGLSARDSEFRRSLGDDSSRNLVSRLRIGIGSRNNLTGNTDVEG